MIDIRFQLKKLRYKRRRNEELGSMNFGAEANQFFLIAYPKSGNTWVRVLLANLLNTNPELEIAFHNVGDFIPDSHNRDQRKYIIRKDSGFNTLPIQVVKSHDSYKGYFKDKKVIYLLRNGSNVIPSFFHYINARAKQPVTFKDILSGKASHSFGSWYTHVFSWLKAKPKSLLFIQYEKLREQPQEELRRISEFLQLPVDEQRMEEAIRRSDFKEMKRLEEKHGYFNDNRTSEGKKTPFVRKGTLNRDDSEIPSHLLAKVRGQEDSVLKELKKQS